MRATLAGAVFVLTRLLDEDRLGQFVLAAGKCWAASLS